MQEFKILLWCDRHALTEERQPATTTVPISLPDYPGRVIDLCDECNTFLFADLLEVVGKNGRPVGGEPQKPARQLERVVEEGFLCPISDYKSASWNGLRQHWTHQHSKTVGSLAKMYGSRCPVCGEDSGQLGNHGQARHSVTSTYELFELAESIGDPYGVVAATDGRFARYR